MPLGPQFRSRRPKNTSPTAHWADRYDSAVRPATERFLKPYQSGSCLSRVST